MRDTLLDSELKPITFTTAIFSVAHCLLVQLRNVYMQRTGKTEPDDERISKEIRHVMRSFNVCACGFSRDMRYRRYSVGAGSR